MRISAGPRITTVAGQISRTTAGSGCPEDDLDWGPAWVSWRTGGDYIGWAPLPPRGPGVVYEGQPIGVNVDVAFDIGPEYYNFCDVRFIGEPVLRDRIFPPVQNVTYITNTVNVTNITCKTTSFTITARITL